METCAGCGLIGRPYGLIVDHLTDEPIPDVVRRFIVIDQEAEARGFPDQLERWMPVTTERARAWLASQAAIRERARQELADFARRARRRWASALDTLSSDERAVFACLETAGADGTSAEAIERCACLASADADRVIASLVAREIVRHVAPAHYRDSRLLARYAIAQRVDATGAPTGAAIHLVVRGHDGSAAAPHAPARTGRNDERSDRGRCGRHEPRRAPPRRRCPRELAHSDHRTPRHAHAFGRFFFPGTTMPVNASSRSSARGTSPTPRMCVAAVASSVARASSTGPS